jgi:amino acid transporter
MKNKKTMYYIVGAILIALALYFFWFKPKKKKENPNWNLLGSSKPTVNTTADGVLASQTSPIVPDTNVTDTDPTVGTAAATTRMAQLSGVRTLYPTPTNAGYPTLAACKSSGARICEKKADGNYYTWE